MYVCKLCLIGLLVLVATATEAKTVTVGKLSVDIQGPWQCSLEGAELVCTKDDGVKPGQPPNQDQLIVITSRTRGTGDGIKLFHNHLKIPRSYKGPDGVSYTAKIKYVKDIKIAGYVWVDSEQFQSEVPGYTTRYLATVIGRTSVIATFSAKKELFDDFNKEIPKFVQSFKVRQ